MAKGILASILGAAIIVLAICSTTGNALAADPPVHFLHGGILAPGAIGAMQLQRGGPLQGYYQPVEVRAPQDTAVAFAHDGQFLRAHAAPVEVAMLVGSVYRLRIVNIPRHEGDEVFPTIEIINRLYPPLGEELRFPIPIELTQEDLELAISGKFITRVIYLEDPRAAYARVEDPNLQHTLEAGPHDDPLVTADRLGRPMAILRIGGRVPEDASNPDCEFLYNSPPLMIFAHSQSGNSPARQPISPYQQQTPMSLLPYIQSEKR
jgi:hypothetical protein